MKRAPGQHGPRGRAAAANPPNRFESVHCEPDLEELASTPPDDDQLNSPAAPVSVSGENEPTDPWSGMPGVPRAVATEFVPDRSQSIISENNSPDIGFRYSINAYRGCEHGCAYCYARPSHELLGMGAGLDFETKILVKHDASRLLREALCQSSWKGDLLVLSGVTDCYQPAERRLKLTRGLLEVMLEARQCVAIVTKNALVLRDLDLLSEMAQMRLAEVSISITTLDADLARVMEPRTSAPQARLRAIKELTAAGIPTRVMVSPIIPGLNDHEIPQVLEAAAAAGAQSASSILLRLPLAVRPVFLDWLTRNYPDRQMKVESLIRSTRGGKLNSSQWGERMRGQGNYAEQIRQNFKVFARKLRLDRPLGELDTSLFRPPRAASGQLRMF